VPILLYTIKQNNDNCEHSHVAKATAKERQTPVRWWLRLAYLFYSQLAISDEAR
jgi:hypothetical protein